MQEKLCTLVEMVHRRMVYLQLKFDNFIIMDAKEKFFLTIHIFYFIPQHEKFS